jgi:DNA-binding Lrp family transcriptional regulator
MISENVIERFITLVNPSILGYNMRCTFAIRKNELSKEIIDRIKLVGDIQYQFSLLGGAVGFSILVREGSEEKIELLLKSLQHAILGITVQNNIYPDIPKNLTDTDYHIVKQLVLNPRIEVTDIGKTISISPKTVHRRLDRILKYRILEFTILPNPHAMKGQIVFFLEVKIERGRYSVLLETIFSEHNNLILSLLAHDQESTIGLILASDDVFKIESIRSRVESFDGVKEANIFLPIRIDYNQDMIVKAIERRLAKVEKAHHDNKLSLQTASH